MTPFEDELKKALARREPSPEFSARLFEKIASQNPGPSQRAQSGTWPFFLLRLGAVAALVALLFGGWLYRRHVETVKGEAARQKLLVAMRIAGSELHAAQSRVIQIQQSEVVIQ